jgi:hypothetical protein
VSQRADSALRDVAKAVADATEIEKQMDANPATATFRQQFKEVVGPPFPGYGTPVIPVDTDETSLRHLSTKLRELLTAIQSADTAPTPEQVQAVDANVETSRKTLAAWQALAVKVRGGR